MSVIYLFIFVSNNINLITIHHYRSILCVWPSNEVLTRFSYVGKFNITQSKSRLIHKNRYLCSTWVNAHVSAFALAHTSFLTIAIYCTRIRISPGPAYLGRSTLLVPAYLGKFILETEVCV